MSRTCLSNVLLFKFFNKNGKHTKDLVIDTAKNACDLSLPLKALGYLPGANPALIALLGTISSVSGIFPLMFPDCKLP